MSKQQQPTSIRMPDDLKAWVRGKAKTSMRSVSNEVVFILMQVRQKEEGKQNA
ncbi:hypothetical protein ACSZNH_09120 [Aeromonas dhakensis]|uniref:hypothetical protein n=1 Tax=Aeromonas dhakensis TaxID=196024 RepID=UPI003EC7E87F|nr:hypothetical protein [Aeromonas dhakensis]